MSKSIASNPVEGIKAASNFLRGTLQESLLDGASGTITDDDSQLSLTRLNVPLDERTPS